MSTVTQITVGVCDFQNMTSVRFQFLPSDGKCVAYRTGDFQFTLLVSFAVIIFYSVYDVRN